MTTDSVSNDSDHKRLISIIRRDVEQTSHFTGRSALKPEVMAAMSKVDRTLFVPEESHAVAWGNHPLPIGFGQTISQPYIVALMSDLLDIGKCSRVLEIGTGSGYQAAVLAELVDELYTLELVPELAERARECLDSLGYQNVHVRCADGFEGLSEFAPYDAIILTASPKEVPSTLIEQLKVGGRLVAPIGSILSGQTLYRATREDSGKLRTKAILPVSFVPMLKACERAC